MNGHEWRHNLCTLPNPGQDAAGRQRHGQDAKAHLLVGQPLGVHGIESERYDKLGHGLEELLQQFIGGYLSMPISITKFER